MATENRNDTDEFKLWNLTFPCKIYNDLVISMIVFTDRFVYVCILFNHLTYSAVSIISISF